MSKKWPTFFSSPAYFLTICSRTLQLKLKPEFKLPEFETCQLIIRSCFILRLSEVRNKVPENRYDWTLQYHPHILMQYHSHISSQSWKECLSPSLSTIHTMKIRVGEKSQSWSFFASTGCWTWIWDLYITSKPTDHSTLKYFTYFCHLKYQQDKLKYLKCQFFWLI